MSKQDTKTDAPEATHLGKNSPAPRSYDPALLVAVPRQVNRDQYNIDGGNLPFGGVDVWHAWEVGFLTDNGLPVVGVLKLVYPCHSEFLVESKSLKLYLNSFNMEALGATREQATETFLARTRQDLSECVKAPVQIGFFAETANQPAPLGDYPLLELVPGMEAVPFTEHTESPGLLQKDDTETPATLHVATHLLRSNCKITHQPDWGSAFIHMAGPSVPTRESLLQYIVSFRNESHFHEEVCEMIYKRLWDTFSPTRLSVTCIYTRRGGIDISPTRSSHSYGLTGPLIDPAVLTGKLPRQ